MNFSFNKNTYNSGPKLVIPKHISNRRIMSADAKTAGRKDPTPLTFAGLEIYFPASIDPISIKIIKTNNQEINNIQNISLYK